MIDRSCKWCGKRKRGHLGISRRCFDTNDSTTFEPSVAPGEAQREPKCDTGSAHVIDGRGMCVYCGYAPAVPSEVAPSQAQKEKTPMKHEVVEDRNQSGDYRVEAIDSNNDGEVFTAIFVGPDAELRAKEYAQWKNR